MKIIAINNRIFIMFNIGLPELILIIIIAIVVVGPDRIPEVAKMLGKTIGTIKNALDDVKGSIEKEVYSEIEKPLKDIDAEIKVEVERAYQEAQKIKEEVEKPIETTKSSEENKSDYSI